MEFPNIDVRYLPKPTTRGFKCALTHDGVVRETQHMLNEI
jgi:hypothetical protein